MSTDWQIEAETAWFQEISISRMKHVKFVTCYKECFMSSIAFLHLPKRALSCSRFCSDHPNGGWLINFIEWTRHLFFCGMPESNLRERQESNTNCKYSDNQFNVKFYAIFIRAFGCGDFNKLTARKLESKCCSVKAVRAGYIAVELHTIRPITSNHSALPFVINPNESLGYMLLST